jgi:iron-sulfur cluster assembly protein
MTPISFTEEAKNEIQKTLNSPNLPAGYAVRVGMKGGACAGTYLFGLDKATENDENYQVDNIPVLIDKRHLMYVLNLEVGYEENEDGNGYTFHKDTN